jgi:hypothetical protein
MFHFFFLSFFEVSEITEKSFYSNIQIPSLISCALGITDIDLWLFWAINLNHSFSELLFSFYVFVRSCNTFSRG